MKTKLVDFKRTYQKLKDKRDWKFSIELYHNDFSNEPMFHSESYPYKVMLDFVDEHGLIILILTPENAFSFSEKNWSTHADEDYVSFGSKNSDQTYCIIEFC